MFRKKYIPAFALGLAVALSVPSVAQTSRPITWSQDLAFLQKLTPAEAAVQQETVDSIHHEVERWLALHPNKQVKLSAVPSRPWTEAQTEAQIEELSAAVTILAADEAHPFHLGQTEVVVSAAVSPLSPNAVSVSQDQLQATDTIHLTQAIDQLPGIEISHNSGMRNEASYYLRGFSNTEVPLYVDGIPQYVPYDGRIDLNRFLISDLAEVQVTRGYTSVLLGPNAMAGSINLVTREPQKPYEADLAIGTGSGNQLNSSAIVGRRAKKYFIQGNLDWAQRDYIPLPGGYRWPVGGYPFTGSIKQFTNEDPNTESYDQKYGARIGWTPKPGDEYVFSYTTQKGKKDAMLYLGLDNTYSSSSYKWPYWSKESYYFLSSTTLDDKSVLKSRIYYDKFKNEMEGFADQTYSTPTYISYYDDHTDGGTIEYHTTHVARNAIGASFTFKDDTHHEWAYGSMWGASSPLPQYPWRTLRDQQTSYGIEDLITVTSRLHVTGGFSVDHINGMTVQVYTSSATNNVYGIKANTCAANPTNTSYSGCTPHYTEYNPQVAATYAISQKDTVYVTFSRRGRFPTMSNLFASSAAGSSVPNPNLKDEHAKNWNFGYTRVFNSRFSADIQLFRSDLTDAIVSGYGYTTDSTVCPKGKTSTINGTTYYRCSVNWNAGKSTNQGVEVQIHARPFDRVSLEANYDYLNRYIGDQVTTPTSGTSSFNGGATASSSSMSVLEGIPRHKVSAIATITAPRGIVGTVRERYEGSILLDDSGTAVYAVHPTGYWKTAMAVTDVGVMVPLYKGAKLQTGVNNLLDRYYQYNAGYPEAGRNWFLNLRYQY